MVNIVKCGDLIWNHHEEFIELNTDMLSIGLILFEIGFENERIYIHGKTKYWPSAKCSHPPTW